MDPDHVRRRHVNLNVEEGDNEGGGETNVDHTYAEYNQYASRIDDYLNEEQTFFSDFVQEFGYTQGVGVTQVPNQGVGSTQVPNQGMGSTQVPIQTQNMTNKSTTKKRKRRQSGGQ